MPLNTLHHSIWLQIKELRERDSKISTHDIAHKLCIHFALVEALVKLR